MEVNDNSVVIMDNCSVHHVQGVSSVIKDIRYTKKEMQQWEWTEILEPFLAVEIHKHSPHKHSHEHSS